MRLPPRLQHALEETSAALLRPAGARRIDFGHPAGEAALVAPDSVSWRIFKNPLALLIGGIAAVVLELAEPAVRSGVWQHSTFRADPMGRLRRTGLAAMVTVFGPRSVALPMIAGVVRMHGQVRGLTPAGEPYLATDPALLTWVHATASFGFGAAYSRYVTALEPHELDALLLEGLPAAHLYGALGSPASTQELHALFASMRCRLEPSASIVEFLDIMAATAQFPGPLRWMQHTLVRAAVELVPREMRAQLGLTSAFGLRHGEALLVRAAGALADRIVLPDGPAAVSCRRLGLPTNYLYR